MLNIIPKPLKSPIVGRELIEGFYQGAAGNCASIAIIKCAISLFGVETVFSSATQTVGQANVTLRDGFTTSVTPDHLATARRLSKFAGKNVELLSHAHFLFTVMATRVLAEENDGRRVHSFEEAAATLNDGEHWLEGPKWLGLSDYVREGPNWPWGFVVARWRAKRWLARRPHGIAKSAKHVWYTSKGLHDEAGKVTSGRWSLTGAICLEIR